MILAIDTIFWNPSFTLYFGNGIVESVLFAGNFDAELFLMEFTRVLKLKNAEELKIKKIFISVGGNSLTRERICISTALAIKESYGAELIKVNISELFADIYRKESNCAIIFEVSKEVCLFIISKDEIVKSEKIKILELNDKIKRIVEKTGSCEFYITEHLLNEIELQNTTFDRKPNILKIPPFEYAINASDNDETMYF